LFTRVMRAPLTEAAFTSFGIRLRRHAVVATRARS
jgi:hypothetical protein